MTPDGCWTDVADTDCGAHDFTFLADFMSKLVEFHVGILVEILVEHHVEIHVEMFVEIHEV